MAAGAGEICGGADFLFPGQPEFYGDGAGTGLSLWQGVRGRPGYQGRTAGRERGFPAYSPLLALKDQKAVSQTDCGNYGAPCAGKIQNDRTADRPGGTPEAGAQQGIAEDHSGAEAYDEGRGFGNGKGDCAQGSGGTGQKAGTGAADVLFR
ncbi:hypothetical protein IMSAGC019_01958 [Lachnospiraceae bacterium]|nr:hypothetical protein IMSAGC019_01958 [Lachnospiraceae bacterium]